jgi:hypothetical protein
MSSNFMKRKFVFCVLTLMVIGCSKDKFQTTPSLKIKSTSSKLIPVNGALRVTFEYTDKEGDISDTLFMKKVRLNQRAVTNRLRDTIDFEIFEFPKNDNGEIELILEYQNHLISAESPPTIPFSNPPQKEPDTLALRFVLQDKMGHKSDTVTLNNVIVIR